MANGFTDIADMQRMCRNVLNDNNDNDRQIDPKLPHGMTVRIAYNVDNVCCYDREHPNGRRFDRVIERRLSYLADMIPVQTGQ
ncbi:hypothetical protein D3C78_832730 [compost metagenome]